MAVVTDDQATLQYLSAKIKEAIESGGAIKIVSTGGQSETITANKDVVVNREFIAWSESEANITVAPTSNIAFMRIFSPTGIKP